MPMLDAIRSMPEDERISSVTGPKACDTLVQESPEPSETGPEGSSTSIRPGVRLEDQRTSDLFGIRQPFLQYEGEFDFIVVHGHTPVMVPDLRPNRINIDTGAFATNRLTCLRIGDDGARVLGS